jgi:polyhydroxyalkanoate synthesis regulator phasin
MPGGDEGPGLGELARLLNQGLLRIEQVANRLDTGFVNKEIFKVSQELNNEVVRNLRNDIKTQKETCSSKQDLKVAIEERKRDTDSLKSKIEELQGDVKQLQDDKVWLQRLVYGFIVLAVLGLLFTVAKNGGSVK